MQRYGLDLSRPPPHRLTELFSVPVSEVRVEIGFGGGEHLIHAVRANPTVGYIGAEPFVNGSAKLMTVLQTVPAANLRVYTDDATDLLDWLPDGSVTGVDILFPDPWPKKRHWKRRFVQPTNLDRLARVLQRGGVLRFASDSADYVNWTLLHCRADGRLRWSATVADDWRQAFPEWPGTRYEGKALREGRKPAYLIFTRE